MMDFYHLNCASMNPPGKRLINGRGGWFESAEIVTHCLLIELESGLILVDTGLSREDVERPARLGGGFRWTMSPALNPREPAYRQIESRGFDPHDVTDIVLTHLDIDHAGGLIDFPDARIHVHEKEWHAADSPTLTESMRYRSQLWDHGPNWSLHDFSTETEQWYGFDSVRPISDLSLDLRMVSLPGHSAGHTGVAIKHNDGWLLHCGDAYFDPREMRVDNPDCTFGFWLQQRMISRDNDRRIETQERLRKLKRNHEDVRLMCSHSVKEFRQFTE